MKQSKEAGFNLIELMIVIAVIALLISISGYAWQVMVRRGNEVAAVAFLSKINTAQAYFASKNKGRFAARFPELVAANLLEKSFDRDLAVIDGYIFTLKVEDSRSRSFVVNADPEISKGIGTTGTSHYYLDSESHSITSTEEERPASRDDPSL